MLPTCTGQNVCWLGSFLCISSQRSCTTAAISCASCSVSVRGPARRFVHAHGITYPIGFDQVGDAVVPYGVNYTPTTFFVDRRGRIVQHVLGAVSTEALEAGARRALRT